MEMYYERQARQAEIDKEQEARRIARERLGHGIAGLAASIGDMVRASEGAPVSQRDWQRIYDNLNAQERANINNYQVRLAKLNEDARQERLIEAQRRAQQEAAAREQAIKLKIEQDKLDARAAEGAADRKSREGIADADRKSREQIARDKLEHDEDKDNTPKISTGVFGRDIIYPKHAEDSIMRQVAGLLNSYGVSMGIISDVLDPQKQQALNIKVTQILKTKATTDKDGKTVYEVPADMTNSDNKATVILGPAEIAEIQAVFDKAAALSNKGSGNGNVVPEGTGR
jgi:hypothetical protein